MLETARRGMGQSSLSYLTARLTVIFSLDWEPGRAVGAGPKWGAAPALETSLVHCWAVKEMLVLNLSKCPCLCGWEPLNALFW